MTSSGGVDERSCIGRGPKIGRTVMTGSGGVEEGSMTGPGPKNIGLLLTVSETKKCVIVESTHLSFTINLRSVFVTQIGQNS
jgi:hypothetical protein